MSSEIPDFNDRCTLVLLQKKKGKSSKETKKIKTLIFQYPNHEIHEDRVIGFLIREGFLEVNGLMPNLEDENGYPVQNPDSSPYLETTKIGETALINGYFPSDYAARVYDVKAKRLQTMLAIGGVLLGVVGWVIGYLSNKC